MKFKEYLLTTSEAASSYAHAPSTKKFETSIQKKYDNCRHLIIRIIPSHPYQYLPHRELKSMLVPAVIKNIQEKHHIGHITFLVGNSTAKGYRSIISQTSYEAKYSKPHYPFTLKNIMTIPDEYQLIDWFDFIVLAKAAIGEQIKDFPISVTLFGTSGAGGSRKREWVTTGPAAVTSIAEQAGISQDEYIFTDHPFAGSVFDSDTKIIEPRAHELLIFPKKNTGKGSFTHTFLSKFASPEQRINGIFDFSDTYRNNPCRKCLDCVSICPEGLYPFMLSAISERGNLKEAVGLQVEKCTECGLCSSACPSGIPLMHNILKLKKEL